MKFERHVSGTGFPSSRPCGTQKILNGGLTQRSHPASQNLSFLFARFGEQVRPRTNKKAPLSSTKRPLCPGLDYRLPEHQYLERIVCQN